jgi:hypothetical protein
VGIKLLCPFQKLNPCHPRHPLIAQQQGHRLLPRLQLLQSVQRCLSASRSHHTVFGSVLASEVLNNRFQNADIIIYRY